MNQPNMGAWDQINSVGKPPTPQEEAAFALEQAKARQIACDFAAIFSTEQGARVLEWLKNKTIFQPTLPAAAMAGLDGMTVSILQNIREGENNLVRLMESQIKKGVKPNEPAL